MCHPFLTFNTHNLPHTTRLKEIIIEMYIKRIRIIMRAVSILCTLLCKLPSYRDSNAYICGNIPGPETPSFEPPSKGL
jgi:hypothetical protein